jgi:hypothetical protein
VHITYHYNSQLPQEVAVCLLAIWKLFLTLTNSAVGVHRALRSEKQEKAAMKWETGTTPKRVTRQPKTNHASAAPLGWIIIYVIGTFIGAVALFSRPRDLQIKPRRPRPH